MVTNKEALILSRWNGSVKLLLNDKIIVESQLKPGGVFGKVEKDSNSNSSSSRAAIRVTDEIGNKFDGSLILTRHNDINKTSCCLFVYGETGNGARMIDIISVKTSNAEGVF